MTSPHALFKIIIQLTNAFNTEIDGVIKQKDIEHLHRLRVTSRRLRTVLRTCKPLLSPQKYNYYQKHIRAVTRSLGHARDLDTQIMFLQTIHLPAPAGIYRKGIDTLLHTLHTQRSHAQPAVKKAIKVIRKKKILSTLTKEILAVPACTALAVQAAHTHIQSCVKKLTTYHAIADKPHQIIELHHMRIAAKHLRYCLENAHELLPTPTMIYIRQARLLQRTLGDMHNYHLWRTRITAVDTRSSIQERLVSGHIHRICTQKEKDAYNRFLQAWTEQEKAGTWKHLLAECLSQ